MRFPGERLKALTLSYDDGSDQDIRLVETLDKYGIKGTFNISAGLFPAEPKPYKEGRYSRRMTKEECVRLYKDSAHEVAVHGYSHPILSQLPTASISAEVLLDRMGLEEVFERDIRGMAYPFGDCSCNAEVLNALRAAGIVYSRMTSATRGFSLPNDWLQWRPTCKHMDERLMELAEKFAADKSDREPKLFYLWGHSFEFERDNNWDVIENFCELMGGRDDIWYATNIEIYDYVQAYHRLVWTADMKRVYNPSVIPISFQRHTIEDGGEVNKSYTVGAGETLAF